MPSQRNPQQIDRESAEADRAARDRYASERESYRAEAEGDAEEITRLEFPRSETECAAFKAGVAIGRRDERNRLLAALTRLEQETAALWQEGSAVTRAVAAYTAAVRKCVEGGGK